MVMKKTYAFILVASLVCALLFSCTTTKHTVKNTNETNVVDITSNLQLTPAPPPTGFDNINANFYKDIAYGNSKQTLFDIFIPKSAQPASLLVYIHGGGFKQGDKAEKYIGKNSIELIKLLLSKNIAFASINYTLLTPASKQGVIECLNDSKRALQFIRYHSKALNIDKEKIVLMGGSAGAGTSLWLAFTDDLADKNNPDPVLRESTRVKGAIAMASQATYNLLSWDQVVFKPYQSQGFNREKVASYTSVERLLNFYGIAKYEDLELPATKAYANKVDMLALMTNDDPEIYVENIRDNVIPSSEGELLHHPLHAKALFDKAQQVHLKGDFFIPSMKIDTRNGEKVEDFIFRLIGK